MNEPTIAPVTARRIAAPDDGASNLEDTIVGGTFAAVCATVLVAAFMMAFVLSLGHMRPVPAYAIFGSGLFGAVFAAFIVGAVNLAVMDARRQRESGSHHH